MTATNMQVGTAVDVVRKGVRCGAACPCKGDVRLSGILTNGRCTGDGCSWQRVDGNSRTAGLRLRALGAAGVLDTNQVVGERTGSSGWCCYGHAVAAGSGHC